MAPQFLSKNRIFISSVVWLLSSSPAHEFVASNSETHAVTISRTNHYLFFNHHDRQKPKTAIELFAEKKNPKTKGVYVRPSGAIERGSGFFVPGLEGPRVRLVFGVVLLLLTAINHALMEGGEYYTLEESIAVVYSLLVLFQAAIEFGKEALIIEGAGDSKAASVTSTTNKDLIQKWNSQSKLDEEYKSRVQWSAASYLAVTPATQMLLLDQTNGGGIIAYQLGNDLPSSLTSTEEAISAAFDQLSQSKGGRIALPNTHPAVEGLRIGDKARTVVLQRISHDKCWMMSSSDQLLASFTPEDLKWLGRLGTYVASSSLS